MTIYKQTLSIYYLAVFAILISSCSEYNSTVEGKIQTALADTLIESTEGWNIAVNFYQNKQLKAKLLSPKSLNKQTRKENISLFSGPVTITVFDSLLQVSSTILCERAQFDAKKSEFDFWGGVEITSTDDKVLYTEYLKWYQSDRTIFTDNFVTIITKEDSLSGYGLNGSDDLSTYEILNVSGNVTIE